jgi:hypothetical protein
VVLYGLFYALAPASSVAFTSDLGRVDPVRLRVRVTRGGPVQADERDAILSLAGAEVVDGDVPATRPISHRLTNRTRRTQSYLLYRGARALTGRWRARRCGAPYNDGREVVTLTGTFRTVGPPGRLRLTACGRVEEGLLARRAARRACS